MAIFEEFNQASIFKLLSLHGGRPPAYHAKNRSHASPDIFYTYPTIIRLKVSSLCIFSFASEYRRNLKLYFFSHVSHNGELTDGYS